MGLSRGGRRLSGGESLQIAIAHAVEGELAATDALDQLAVIRREGLERAYPPTMPVRGLAKSVQDFVKRGVLIDAGQRIQVAFGGFAGHFGTAVQVGNAPPERTPGQRTLGVAFLGPIHAKVLDRVERRLGTHQADQLGERLVVELDRVVVEAVFDAHSFLTLPQITDDLASESLRKLSVEGHV